MQPITTLAGYLALLAAVTCSAVDGASQTNATGRPTTVAVMSLAEDPSLLDPRDAHWLRTFSALVTSDLRQVAALRLLPESAVLRELARQKIAEPYSSDAVAGIKKLGENLHADWVVVGALTHTGSVWTVRAYAVETATGNFGQRLSFTSTNWFELRDQVVQHVLQRLLTTPSPAEQTRLGRVWTHSPQAFEWFSQAMSVPAKDAEQEAALYRMSLAADPDFIEARNSLAGTLYNIGDNEACLSTASEGLRQKPDRYVAATLHLIRATALTRLGRDNEAQQAAEVGWRLWPEHPQILVFQAFLHESRSALEAAHDCLDKAVEYDPGNPSLHAMLARNQSRQGELTNALANLELAERLALNTDPDDQPRISWALAEAYVTFGKLEPALRHYRLCLAAAPDRGVPESDLKWLRDTVENLERRSEAVPVAAETPRRYSSDELQAALRAHLDPEELPFAANPIAGAPEMAVWARETVGEIPGELARARKLFDLLVARPRATGGSTRTAQEVFAAWKDPGQSFTCQEYAKLFVALARSLEMPAFYVHVDRDYSDRIVDHDCVVVFADGKAWLVDPAYAWFGVPHREFRVLDDLQAIAHHAFQPHDGERKIAPRRAGCKLDPEFTWGRMSLVAALIDARQLEEAQKELTSARQKAPDYWQGYKLEGMLARLRNLTPQAVEWFRKAAQANPDDGATRFLLGQALFENGQHAAAREELLAGLRRPHQRKDEEVVAETLALIEAAVGPGSNVIATAKSPLTAEMYHNLATSFMAGSSPNYVEAAKWFRRAAEMGDPQAQGTLGVLYWNGLGVPKDPVKGFRWLRMGADGKDPQAMRNLGKAYDEGLGVKRNLEEALRWMRRAAEAGDAAAQGVLGKAYYEGRDTPKDVAEALSWLMLSSEGFATPSGAVLGEREPGSAFRALGHLLKEVELFASAEEKAEAKARVDKFKAKRILEPKQQQAQPITPDGVPADKSSESK